MSLGPMELVVILLIFVVLFGGKKLPQLGEGIGKALSNFKKAVNTDETDLEKKSELEETVGTK